VERWSLREEDEALVGVGGRPGGQVRRTLVLLHGRTTAGAAARVVAETVVEGFREIWDHDLTLLTINYH
jgi:hypothetical protein